MSPALSMALYRRYRPETYADVIGQEHVTEPLMQALRTGRVNHAYLFSGPRGCGKTTSARILARCLNCEKGPTPTPCGECQSCVALARGGSGTVDVIEIDAASHGGVDDARDLRERASYGPAQSRYKIYIIDEAHMVTPQGFNALLKIVEEPPEHVKFVFATTEPEKVIGTIRSRTHHYPFRLVPPGTLSDYMQKLCDSEGVQVEPGVLSFVTRAGGGSVRDSLSVLDQLIAGSGDAGLTYSGAASLLGFTDGELLDAVVDALAAHDSGAVFRQIDKVIESGHDPRRFIEDLLERLRDLIVIAAVPDGAGQVLRAVPEDQLERMRIQASAYGPGALSRAADVVNSGLTEMTGATAPRLQLELICARILLPAGAGEQGYAARLDRLERRLEMGEMSSPATDPTARRAPVSPPAAPVAPIAVPPAAVQAPSPESPQPVSTAPAPASAQAPAPTPAAEAAPPAPSPVEQAQSERPSAPADAPTPAPEQALSEEPAASEPQPSSPPEPAAPAAAAVTDAAPVQSSAPAQSAGGPINTDVIRRAWPDVLDRIFKIKRVTWTLLSQHAQVIDYNGERLLLGTSTAGLAETFRRGQHPEVVRQALVEAIGVDCKVEAKPHEGGTPPGGQAPPASPPSDGGPPDDEPAPDDVPPPPEQSGPGRPSDQRGAPGAPSGPSSNESRGGPSAVDAAGLGGATPRGGWDSDSSGTWSNASAPPPDWAGPSLDGAAASSAPANTPARQQDSAPKSPAAPTSGPARTRDGLTPRQRAELAAKANAGANSGGGIPAADDSAAHLDDENIEDSGAIGVPVIQSVLGGTIIAEENG